MEIRTLNFADSAEADHFLESHGGEVFLKDKYPQVYQAYLRTREEHSSRVLCAAPGSSGHQSCTDSGNTSDILCVHVTPPTEEETMKLSASDDGQGCVNGQGYVGVNSKAIVDVSKAIVGVTISGYMYDSVTMRNYGSFYEDFSDQDIRETAYHCIGNCRRNAPKEAVGNLVVKCQIDCVNSNGALEHVEVQSSAEGINLKDIIESFTVTAPVSRHGKSEVVVVCKDREWAEHDYFYPKIKPVAGRVKTMLPISGKITFKSRFKPVEFTQQRTDNIKLVYEGDIDVVYGHKLADIAEHFQKPQGQTVEFNLDDDWNATLPSEKYNAKLKTFLSCPFYYTVADTKDIDAGGKPRQKHIPFWIGSTEETGITYYHVKEDGNVYVPPITYQWGCFAKDTMILMDDGSFRNIAEICAGDYVWTQDGVVQVESVVTGTEKQIIVIETEGDHRLRVTQGHPVLTSRGCLSADELSIEDKIVLRDGTAEAVKFLYMEEYGDKIYSLDLGEAHILCANGILAGDFRCQNEGLRQRQEEEQVSEDVRELVDELRRLNRELAERMEVNAGS